MFKDAIKGAFCVNTRLNDAFYKTFSRSTLRHMKRVEECGKIDSIADISELRRLRASVSEGESFYTTDANVSNSLIYGIWDSMFGDHRDEPIYYSPAVEHGLIFHDQIFTDLRFTARAGLVTFGDYRYERIRRYKKEPIYEVGPYIHYAKPYYDENRVAQLKRENGKTLLVFPAHSVDTNSISQDEDRYAAEVARIAKEENFDTVLVNSFWWNINDPVIRRFEAEGYHIVSAGFRDDVKFLSRLRTIIQMSDLIVGDGIGTHIGYALDLNVPFRFVDIATTSSSIDDAADPSARQNALLRDKIARLFSNATAVTEQQRDALEPYWGFSHMKTRSQMENIYQITRAIVRASGFGGGWSRSYGEVAHDLCKEYEECDPEKARLLQEALR